MPATRIEATCELGRVYVKPNGCEQVEFTDLTGRKVTLQQMPGSDNVALRLTDNYATFPRHVVRGLVCTLGRLLETGSMVNGEGVP